MLKLVYAEHRKSAHTLGKSLPFLVPVFNLLLAFCLTGGIGNSLPAGAWNWWYTMILPGTMSVFCYLCVKKDKRMKYYHVFTLPVVPEKSWMAKIIYCTFGMLISNLVTFLGTWIGGSLFGTTVLPFDGLAAACLLSIAYAWNIPLFLFLSEQFGMFASVFTGIALPMTSVFTLADSKYWCFCPSAIPIRLMCPVLGILPNGLPAALGSGMESSDIILPGIILSALWFIFLTILTGAWFKRKEN